MHQLVFDSILEETKPAQEPKIEQLEFDIEDKFFSPLIYLNQNPQQIFTISPEPNIVFSSDNKECGRFSWKDGVFKFEGNAETSAKLFVNHIAQYAGLKIKT